MTCLSKVFSFYARLEWGLSDLNITTPIFFSAKTDKGDEVNFTCVMEDHEDMTVFIPEFDQFLLMLIPNKKGDNFIVLDKIGCSSMINKRVTFKDIANVIRRKTRFEVTKDILHDN
jgi:hypothetical protein